MLGLAVFAILLPVAVFMIALPYVSWLENIIPKSLVPDDRPIVSNQANDGRTSIIGASFTAPKVATWRPRPCSNKRWQSLKKQAVSLTQMSANHFP